MAEGVAKSVRARVERYLAEVDAGAPGLVEAVYLTGSTALGDFRPGRSDIDLLVVTSRPVAGDDAGVLAAAHSNVASPAGPDGPTPPHLDGIYLERARLAAQPDDGPVVPHVINGHLHTDRRCGELSPVVWLTLLRYGVAMRGPAPSALGLSPPDRERLRRWNLDNLRSYWATLAAQARQAADERHADATVAAEAVVWTVLGPPRLHYTLAHADVISKLAAAGYVARHFPSWAGLAGRAARWRAGEPVDFTAVDASAAAALTNEVIADAIARWD